VSASSLLLLSGLVGSISGVASALLSREAIRRAERNRMLDQALGGKR